MSRMQKEKCCDTAPGNRPRRQRPQTCKTCLAIVCATSLFCSMGAMGQRFSLWRLPFSTCTLTDKARLQINGSLCSIEQMKRLFFAGGHGVGWKRRQELFVRNGNAKRQTHTVYFYYFFISFRSYLWLNCLGWICF